MATASHRVAQDRIESHTVSTELTPVRPNSNEGRTGVSCARTDVAEKIDPRRFFRLVWGSGTEGSAVDQPTDSSADGTVDCIEFAQDIEQSIESVVAQSLLSGSYSNVTRVASGSESKSERE